MQTLEADFQYITVKDQVTADAIVIHGGFTNETLADSGTELGDGIDRLLHGLRLYKSSKAPYLVVMGGAPRGYTPEAVHMSRLLVELGVAPDAILLEDRSRNTWENVPNVMPVLRENNINRVLVVTSAFHMRRALGVFEKLGIEAIPAATDYQIIKADPPQADGLVPPFYDHKMVSN